MVYRFVAVFLAIPALAMAQIVGNPAGPRPGTVHVLEVSIAGPHDLQILDSAGYNLGHYDGGNFITVYATPEEHEALAASGYDPVQIGHQPDPPVFEPGAKGLGVYHGYSQLTTELQDYAAAYPALTQLTSLGQSVQGREIWALLITDNPGDDEAKPAFKYVSTMHGDEPVGTEMCLYLIDYLLNGYGVDGRVTALVDSTAIWFVPLMNPDGLEIGQRFNANGIDLNRAFPEFPVHYTGMLYDGEPLGDAGRQPEIQAIMQWSANHNFVLSANLHTGALVMNYPYDHAPGIPSGQYAATPDDLLFRDVSLRYSMNNPPMFNSVLFSDGITNGSDWFAITGGMMDWLYRYLGCKDVTIELSSTKKPAESTLPTFWANNQESMLAYLEAVHIGVRGTVQDARTGQPIWAEIAVAGNGQRVFTNPLRGDYYRLLLPGTYTITISAPGYVTKTFTGIGVGSGGATLVNAQLNSVEELPAVEYMILAGLFLLLTILALPRLLPRKPSKS